MFERIVVGTDGSTQALDAVRAAAHLAKLSAVDHIHVVTAATTYSGYELKSIEAELPAEFRDLVDPHMTANERFSEAASAARPFGVEVIKHEQSGGAASAILDVAKAVDADLIVVGARGLGAVGRFLRGSVSTRVAHHSPCNVLIVEHDD